MVSVSVIFLCMAAVMIPDHVIYEEKRSEWNVISWVKFLGMCRCSRANASVLISCHRGLTSIRVAHTHTHIYTHQKSRDSAARTFIDCLHHHLPFSLPLSLSPSLLLSLTVCSLSWKIGSKSSTAVNKACCSAGPLWVYLSSCKRKSREEKKRKE